MKVYIVGRGKYEDKVNKKVFLDKDKAEEYISLWDGLWIEEFETYDDNFELGKYKIQNYVEISYNF